MVDIFLELPTRVLQSFRTRALLEGRIAEDLIRQVLIDAAPPIGSSAEEFIAVADEPVVKAAEIENACRRLGYEFGWRFITCPQDQAASAKLLLVTLNPGGRAVHGPAWSQEQGSAYRVEAWSGSPTASAPLQRQVLAMWALLGLRDEEVFSAHYVPFRSPTWNDLARRDEAEQFARRLWTWMKPQLSFDRIVCIGKEKPGRPIAELFGATLERSMPVGWGEITADRYRLPDGRPLVALPHLSRFGIFGRPQGRDALNALFELSR